MAKDDLTDYERLRLENIRRNEMFLQSIGIESKQESKTDFDKIMKAVNSRKKINEPRLLCEHVTCKRRRSSRLNPSIDTSVEEGHTDVTAAVGDNMDEDENAHRIKYAEIPAGSDELDDFEFQIYTELRRWRKSCYLQLEIEPYKIFQNRTLLEFIRRKRDKNWAVPMFSSDVTKDLLECWGIGPSKVEEDGFGQQMLKYFYDSKLDVLLKKSLELENNERKE